MNSMKTAAFAMAIVLMTGSFAKATTIFSDNFDRSDSSTVGNNWIETAGNADPQIASNLLSFSGITGNGISYVTQSMANFDASWNTKLSLNSGLVTWTFNMQQSRANPAAFGSGSYSNAFVLAGTSATLTSGTGYAIILGNNSTPDPIRLVKYTSGLATSTDIISANSTPFSDAGANYYSVKVVYNPSTNEWTLSLRNDGTTSFSDPLSGGTYTTFTTQVDSTYTDTIMSVIGAAYSHSSGTAEFAKFDNISITAVPESQEYAIAVAGLLGLVILTRRRRIVNH